MVTFDPELANVVASNEAADRWALIDADGIVRNVVLWDGNLATWQPPEGLTPRQLRDTPAHRAAGVGSRYASNGRYIPGDVPQPAPPSGQLTVTDPAAFNQALAATITAQTAEAKLDALTALLSHIQT